MLFAKIKQQFNANCNVSDILGLNDKYIGMSWLGFIPLRFMLI